MARDGVASGPARRELLVQRRKAVGLTQEQLAGQLNVDRTTVARWERGEAQPLPWLRPRLARALGVPADRIEELLAAAGALVSSQGRAAVVPRQVPAAVAGFTGRAAELAALTRILDQAGTSAPGSVVISAIGGTAGVGKTALALHWAHQVAGRFSDGQLYVNLRGFDPAAAPAAPEAAIRGFLNALGLPPERIPAGPEEQAGLYRSLLADKQMLIVADNARDEQQVRPLLPASPGSLVLVTSRSQMPGLAAADGARLISLDVLSHGEAVDMLAARLGTARIAAEPAAADRITRLCVCLPLALAVAAARAAARPGLPLAALAGELADSAGRLDALDAGDPAASVRAVFSWSARQLSADAARMFRLLGLHPGPDISAPAAASLAAVTQAGAERLLRQLAGAHLITEHVPGRYTFHDLLRAYAADQARACDSEPDRRQAIGRILDHYLHSARNSSFALNSTIEPVTLLPPRPGTAPEQFASPRDALAWFDAEHLTLTAAAGLAAETGFDSHAWQLPWAMTVFLRKRGHWQQWAATQHTALTAAARAGDLAGQATSGRLLATAYDDLGDHDRAYGCYLTSLELYEQLGDRCGQARTLAGLGMLAARQGRLDDALRYDERALSLYQAAGYKPGEAITLYGVGWDHGLLGDYEQARAFCQQALTLTTETGNRDINAAIWDTMGYAEHHLGNLAEAAACYHRALTVIREFGDRWREAVTLDHLGDTHHAAGDQPAARQTWQHALAILEDLDHPHAAKIRSKLADINDNGSQRPSA